MNTDKSKKQFLPFGAPDFTDAEIEAVTRVMRSGWIGMGPETLAFEKELADYLGVTHVVTVSSCTAALFLSLIIAGVKPGDEVIVPSLTWCADANVVLQLGAIPVFCDVDPDSFCVTSESIMKALTSKTKAVIAVHYGGLGVDVRQLRAAIPRNVAIIEDAAHAFGADFSDGNKVGSSGNLTCFSFYANKNISTAEGGAIALKDPVIAERLRSLRMNGMASNAWSRYINPASTLLGGIGELGYKMNFTDLQAAIGRVQLARFDAMSARRLTIAQRYQEKFNEYQIQIKFQKQVFDKNHARHLFVGLFDPEVTGIKRNDLLLTLRERNIGASIHYTPLHQMPFYRPYDRGNLEVTEKLATQIMTLPISAKMSVDDVDDAMENIRAILKRS